MNLIKTIDTKYSNSVDNIIYAATLIVSAVFLLGLDYSGTSPLVIMSFFAIGIYSFVSIIRTKKCISVYKAVFIFNYIFYFLAGLQCYCSGKVIWSSVGIRPTFYTEDYLKANFMILLMTGIFDISYNFIKKRIKPKTPEKHTDYNKYIMSNSALIILLILSTIAFILRFAAADYFGELERSENGSFGMQLPRMLSYIPVSTLMLYYIYRRRNILTQKKVFLAIVIIEISILFMPLSGVNARFFQLGTYVVFFALLFSDIKYKSFFWGLMFFGFSLLFTDLRLITSLSSLRFAGIDFVHPDFDAHQILMTLIKYTDDVGICYGKNILSALAFIVPRSIWTEKMNPTGLMLAESYNATFTNISAPLVGEFYFAFSWFGVILAAPVLAYLVLQLDSWATDRDGLKRGLYCIFAGMTIYICRGALLPTMAFTLALSLTYACAYLVVRVLKKF